jgi:DNA-binding MurR/RpiR family transcriptional regulator
MPTASAALATPLDALRHALPGLSPRLRQVGRFVAGHDFDAATRSMRDLAAAAGVNPASFTRLAQALGYSGWDALRDSLIEARRPAPADPFSARVRGGGDAQAPGGMAADMVQADIDALRRMDASSVAGAAQALHDAARIWVSGFRSCRSVALLLHYQLRLFRPDTVRLVGGTGPEDLDFGAFAPGDVVVLTGFAPYSRASVDAARAARAAGCRLVALADAPHAPMAEGADHLLLFEAASGPGFFPSQTGAFALVQALAAAVFSLGGADAMARLRETETRLAAHSQYVPGPEATAP